MEDNAPVHVHYYHDIPHGGLGFSKLIWPASSLDLNLIETIWTELKDILHERIGPKMTAHQIRVLLEEVKIIYYILFYFTYIYFRLGITILKNESIFI